MHLIGLDVGTTGCKAIVFDESGTQKGYGFREYGIETDSTGKAEQDAELVWRLSLEVLREAVGQAEVRDIAALSVSVQGDAVIPVDRDSRPLGKAILGMDYRSRPQAEHCAELFGDRELFERTGMRPHPMNSLTKIMMIKDRNPEVYRNSWKVVTYADYILGRLGAPGFIDNTMASRTMALDLRSGQWADDLLRRVHVDEEKLSKPVPSGTAVGTIRRDLADELGVSPEMLLVTGGHDQTCAATGAGVIGEGRAVVSSGTAEVFSCAFSEPVVNDAMYSGYYPCYFHTVPGRYFTFALNHVGGLLLRWYRDTFCDAEIREAREQGIDAYSLLISRMPKEPSRLLFLPHMNGSGTPWCDLSSKGAVVGLTLAHTKYDVVRAILESQTYELAVNVKTMEQAGIGVREVVVVGGGAKSPQWLQIRADILRRPVSTLVCREAACLGAAVIAGLGAGVYTSVEEACNRTVRIQKTYEPDISRAHIYAEKLSVYEDLYPALKPVNERL